MSFNWRLLLFGIPVYVWQRREHAAVGAVAAGSAPVMREDRNVRIRLGPLSVRRSRWTPAAALLVTAWTGAALRVPAAAQAGATAGSRSWVGEAARIEEALKSAPTVRLEDIGTGVTKPQRAYLEPGGIVASFTWKVLPPARRGGHWESYKSEIAAYELDKRLGLNMVPPTVEREMDGRQGAAVMWVEQAISLKQIGKTLTSERVPGRDIRKMLTFDNFIGNPDRNAGNILIDAANNVILIDHSRAFVTEKDLPVKIERVDEDLWNAIQALTPEDLRAVVGSLIGDAAMDAMLERRSRMKKSIDALVAKKGRSVVIVPSRP
jgi:hypothetical protein